MDYGGKLFSIENWMPTDKKAKKVIDDLIDSKELKSKKGVPSSFKKPHTPMNQGLRVRKKPKKKARKRA